MSGQLAIVGSGGSHLVNDGAFSSEVYFHPRSPLSVFVDGRSVSRPLWVLGVLTASTTSVTLLSEAFPSMSHMPSNYYNEVSLTYIFQINLIPRLSHSKRTTVRKIVDTNGR